MNITLHLILIKIHNLECQKFIIKARQKWFTYFCQFSVASTNTSTSTPNITDLGLCTGMEVKESCDEDGHRNVNWSGIVLMFIGVLLTGVGNCCFYSFGVAYLDDNTSHENSPIMLSITYTLRLVGPTLGYALGTFCLKMYVIPGQKVTMEEGDPNWIGAWWLGFPLIGTLIFIFSGTYRYLKNY